MILQMLWIISDTDTSPLLFMIMSSGGKGVSILDPQTYGLTFMIFNGILFSL